MNNSSNVIGTFPSLESYPRRDLGGRPAEPHPGGNSADFNPGLPL